MRSEIARRQSSKNKQFWFSYFYAAWPNNHRGWSKMKKKNRKLFKKKYRRELQKELNNSDFFNENSKGDK